MKSFIISMCILSFFLGVVKLVGNQNQMGKMTGFVCSLVFIFSVISVFSNASFDTEVLTADTKTNTDVSLETQVSKKLIDSLLLDNGIICSKTSVNADKQDDGSIIINEVKVVIKSGNKEQAEKIIKENTNALLVEAVYE